MNSVLCKLFTLVCLPVLLAPQLAFLMPQTARAFTKNDYYCTNIGGTCFYDPSCAVDADGAPTLESSTAGGGTAQALAKEMLEGPTKSKITYWAASPDSPAPDWTSRVPAGGNKSLVDTKDVMSTLAAGKKAYTTAGNASNKETDINPKILQFILEVSKKDKIMVNALSDKTHSEGSEHYKGLAVDLDVNNSASLSVLVPAAKKFGGTKNGETGHHHFDFPDAPKDSSSGDATAETPEAAPDKPTTGTCACPRDEDTSVDGTPGAGSGEIYQSGLKPPYILEQWAIETLKAIAQKKGVDEKSTVTQEHVIALVAFAIGEGGDIANQDLFNPLNTGLNAPELLDGGQSNSGLQSFKSFDAGVEATARTMIGKNQSRLAAVLIKPESSAKDFMTALTYYQRYPGNALWAEASQPPAQDSYYKQRLQLVSTVRGNYKASASLIIGTRELEQQSGKKDPSKLMFDGSSNLGTVSDSPDDTQGCKCPAGRGGGDASSNVLVGKNDVEKAFKFFVAGGMTPEQAAGVIGNLMAESGNNEEQSTVLNPNASNGTGNEGIVQWDSGRWAKLVAFVNKDPELKKKGPRSLLAQLKFTLIEDATKEYLKTKYKSPEEAATQFKAISERSGGSRLDVRTKGARSVFDKYGKGAAGGASASGSNADCPEAAAAGTKIDLDKLAEDSTKIACAPGTKEIRNDDGYKNGKKVPIKLCEVTNLPQPSGYGSTNGNAAVNSRVSGAVYAMIEAAKKDGISMSAVSTFRTMADQKALCPCDGVSVAKPGKSNHQLGVAIDFNIDNLPIDRDTCVNKNGVCTPPGGKRAQYEWLVDNSKKFDYQQYVKEFWHWSPDGG